MFQVIFFGWLVFMSLVFGMTIVFGFGNDLEIGLDVFAVLFFGVMSFAIFLLLAILIVKTGT